MVFSLGCGLIGGDDEEAKGDPGDERRAQIQAEIAAEAAAAEAAAAGESSGGDSDSAETETPSDAQADAGAAPDGENPPAAAAPVAEASPETAGTLENEEQARNLAWSHISQCTTFNPTELEATLITGSWFVKGTSQASRDFGFWKIPSATAKMTPHDTQARLWESAIQSQCSSETMASLPAQARVISDAAGAGTAVWSYLVQCIPDLSTDIFQSVFNPAEGQWAVVISPEDPNNLGTWMVNPDSGVITPHTNAAQLWDSAARQGCTPEVLEALIQPTPGPTPTPAVMEIDAAVTNLWSYLVKCGPSLTIAELEATWNPVKMEWIVITAPGSELDYGVWTIRPDGSISPSNQEATRRDKLAIGGTC